MKIHFCLNQLFTLLVFITSVSAQVETPAKGYVYIGELKARHALDIDSSMWSVGGETLDRDYADYNSYKKYLGSLGAKKIRLQGGWAKCEPVKGKYDFDWLDHIVFDAYSQGVSPWISLSYGNPIYQGGGLPKLASPLPTSEEALIAWDNWIRATTERYKEKVTEWEIWNEPEINKSTGISGEDYAKFYIRTAEIIKNIQPHARLFAFGLASIAELGFPKEFFEYLKKENKLHLVDVVTFHGYKYNPDDSYPIVEKLEALCRTYVPEIIMMQGENGCPSTPQNMTIGALSKEDWTEYTQAKWNLRRMLGDHGRGYATNVFTISDFHYGASDHMTGLNSKGLLKTFPDKSVDRPKFSYYAVQRTMGLFDNSIQLANKSYDLSGGTNDSITVFTYFKKEDERSLMTIWYHGNRPQESFRPIIRDLSVDAHIEIPVYVDLLSGKIYLIPASKWEKKGDGMVFKSLPISDYPIVIGDLSVFYSH